MQPLTAGVPTVMVLVDRTNAAGSPGVFMTMTLHPLHLQRVQDSVWSVDQAVHSVRLCLDDCLEACPAEKRRALEAELRRMLGSRLADQLDQAITGENGNAN